MVWFVRDDFIVSFTFCMLLYILGPVLTNEVALLLHESSYNVIVTNKF